MMDQTAIFAMMRMPSSALLNVSLSIMITLSTIIKPIPTAAASAQALIGISAECHHSLVLWVANMRLVTPLTRKQNGNVKRASFRHFSSLAASYPLSPLCFLVPGSSTRTVAAILRTTCIVKTMTSQKSGEITFAVRIIYSAWNGSPRSWKIATPDANTHARDPITPIFTNGFNASTFHR